MEAKESEDGTVNVECGTVGGATDGVTFEMKQKGFNRDLFVTVLKQLFYCTFDKKLNVTLQ